MTNDIGNRVMQLRVDGNSLRGRAFRMSQTAQRLMLEGKDVDAAKLLHMVTNDLEQSIRSYELANELEKRAAR